MVKLQCEQCGAPLEIEESCVLVGDNIAIIRSGNILTCEHCGMKYIPGDELGLSGGNVSQVISASNGSVIQGVTQIASTGKYTTIIKNATGIVIGDSGTVVKMDFGK